MFCLQQDRSWTALESPLTYFGGYRPSPMMTRCNVAPYVYDWTCNMNNDQAFDKRAFMNFQNTGMMHRHAAYGQCTISQTRSRALYCPIAASLCLQYGRTDADGLRETISVLLCCWNPWSATRFTHFHFLLSPYHMY